MEDNIYQVYEDEIRLLEEEIQMLTEKYEDGQQESTFYSDEEILMSIKSSQREFQGESKEREFPSDLKAQLETLETDLSFLMKFTGISFTKHSKKTVEKSGSRTIQKHRLAGNCHSLPFQLEFQLLQIKNKENVSAVITNLNIVMESGEYSGVSKFVSSIEERGNLLPFFKSLSSYAEWCEHRRCTFLHFKVVLELMIVWKIDIDEDGRTTPVLDLLPKVPEQVLEQTRATIENAPTCFRSMLLLFGIEAAIENLIKVVGLKE
uniref:Centromere protein P n=1 Tax=Nothoprocta perdicaria TaxID=30464 RepID=A0A8C6YZ64_NOTPE